MDNLDILSDGELQMRLVQCGFPKLPVTATTRDVIIKKIRNHMKGNQSTAKSHRTRSSGQKDTFVASQNAMDNLEYLSDSELRSRLSQYGFSNVPVTSTTRKTLIKKLRSQMESEKTKLRRETSNATRYSSGEDSDIDSASRSSPATKFYGNSSSSYISKYNSNNMMPPPSSTSFLSRRTTAVSSPLSRTTVDSVRPPERSAKSMISVPPLVYSSESDEDSDYLNANHQRESYSSYLSNKSRYSGSPSYSNSPGYGASASYTAQQTHSTSPSYASATSYTAQPSYTSSPNYNYTGNNVINETSIRSRYSTSPIIGRTSTLSPTTAVDGGHSPIINGHSPNDLQYSDDFTKRLLNLRGESIRQTGYNTSPSSNMRPRYSGTSHGSYMPPNPNDIVTQQPEPAAEPHISYKVAIRNFFNKINTPYVFKQSFIPCILLTALLIFFIFVTFMYVTISPDLANTISEKNTIYTLCPDSIQFTGLTTNNDYSCIQKDSIKTALKSLKHIAPELQKKAQHHRCVDNSENFVMTRQDVGKFLVSKDGSIKIRDVREILPNMEYLIAHNPQWKIFNVDVNGNPLTLDDITLMRKRNESPRYAILNPRLPFTCSLYNKFQKFFFFVGGLAVVSLVIAASYVAYKLIVNYQHTKRETVNNLIDDILNNLVKTAAFNPNGNGVVVNHLRDKLIPLHKRKKVEWAWNEAINHLEQHESRIQFEVVVLNGEDFKVMKWIDSAGIEPTDNNTSPVKKWQSPAFDKKHKIHDPPTPCLKIGQMFDKFEAKNPNLKTVIQDAIIEKVGGNCRIHDINLDTVNCCVYVRCASERDAGMIYDEINGWWFDSRLVSIKFVRLERYLHRFPKSTAGPFLRPSNTKNLSLSQCYKKGNKSQYEDDDDDDSDRNDGGAQRRD